MTDISDAASALATLDSTKAREDADALAEAFELAGSRIARSLDQAAKDGELSFNRLAESVLQDLARLAISEIVEAPLAALIGGLGDALSGKTGQPQTVNLNISGATDADSFRRSEGQIAATLARAVSLGQTRI